jgi:hypothetical protein
MSELFDLTGKVANLRTRARHLRLRRVEGRAQEPHPLDGHGVGAVEHPGQHPEPGSVHERDAPRRRHESDPGYLDMVANGTLQRRVADPSEIVGPVLYLASDASSYVTGDDLSLSGGMSK